MRGFSFGQWRQWKQFFWRKVTGVSIRYKLLGMVLLAILALGIAVTLLVQAELEANLRQSLEERGVAITRDLAEDATDLILTQDIFELNQEIRTTLETNPDVRYVFIVDAQGQVVAHSFPERVPSGLFAINHVDGEGWGVQIIRTDEGYITDIAVPIFEGKLGVARVGLSHERLETAVSDITRRLQIVTLITLFVGSLTVLLLTRILTRPVFDLLKAVRAVGQGDLTMRAPVHMEDEIGELTIAFNAMTDDLARSRNELLQQNQQLTVLNQIAWVISGARSLREVIDAALRGALSALDCDAGWIVLLQEDGSSQFVGSKGLSEDFLARETREDIEACYCHKLMHTEEPWQQPRIREDCPRLKRALAWGEPEGCFRHHLTVPLVSHNQPIGVLNLAFSPDKVFSSEKLKLAGAIGRQVGVAIEAELNRQRLVAELEAREALRGQLLERALTAQEEERRRIARELHDEAGQALTSLMVGLRLLEQEAASPEAILHRTSVLKQMTNDVLENLHRLAMDLRPASLDHVGLAAALRQYIDLYRHQTGLDVQLEVVGLERQRLPSEVETTLYRIIQEALTNVARHAQARHVGVLLEVGAERIVAIVEDDGVGFDPEISQRNGRLGLFGMRERAEIIGGVFTIESAPGRGTTVFVEVPHVYSYFSG